MMLTKSLNCFASTSSHEHLNISVSISSLNGDILQLHYSLTGDLSGIRIPSPCPPGPADELWHHTCFELFIAAQNQDSYREFNFSPSGQWTVYGFSHYRERSDLTVNHPPQLFTQADSKQFSLKALIKRSELPGKPDTIPYNIGLSAVIESTDSQLSYWALKHPANQPDFHHRDSFNCILSAF